MSGIPRNFHRFSMDFPRNFTESVESAEFPWNFRGSRGHSAEFPRVPAESVDIPGNFRGISAESVEFQRKIHGNPAESVDSADFRKLLEPSRKSSTTHSRCGDEWLLAMDWRPRNWHGIFLALQWRERHPCAGFLRGLSPRGLIFLVSIAT